MPRKVLVADDSVTIQKVVGITFAAEDIELSFVDNGEEAIELARQIRPDLIIADVLMPRKSGYEVCEAIKQDPVLSRIPVLLLTGTFEPFDAERSRRVGADGTITKPFESQTLIRQVNELLERAATAPIATTPASIAAQSPAVQTQAPPSLAPPPVLGEAESAFADLSRDLSLEPLPASAESESKAGAAAMPEAPVDEAFDFDFESGGSFSLEEGVGTAVKAANAAPTGAEPRLSEREDEFEFVEEPGETLELGEPASTPPSQNQPDEAERPYGAGEPPAQDLFEQGRTPETGEVWDLSDLEAVEESALSEPAPEAAEPDSPTFWDDAAAEAIDLVESVSVDAPEALLLSEEVALAATLDAAERSLLEAPEAPEVPRAARADSDSALADSEPELPRDYARADSEPEVPPEGRADKILLDDTALDLPLTGIDDAPALSGEPDTMPLHPSLEDLPEFDFDAAELGEPLADTGPLEAISDEEPAIEPLTPVPFLGEPFLAEPYETQPSAPAPGRPAAAAPPTPLTAMENLGADTVNDVVRRAVNDAVERVTWEAFSDLSETVVKAVKEKVEQIAWEVIPQMAESLIKDEIKRITEEKK